MISGNQLLDVGGTTFQGLPALTTGYQHLPEAYREASGSDDESMWSVTCQMPSVALLTGCKVTSVGLVCSIIGFG